MIKLLDDEEKGKMHKQTDTSCHPSHVTRPHVGEKVKTVWGAALFLEEIIQPFLSESVLSEFGFLNSFQRDH